MPDCDCHNHNHDHKKCHCKPLRAHVKCHKALRKCRKPCRESKPCDCHGHCGCPHEVRDNNGHSHCHDDSSHEH